MGRAAVKQQAPGLLFLDKIDISGGTQPRALIDEQVVEDYAAALEAGDVFPPLVVFWDGATYWLADGFHRFHAARRVGATEFAVDVKTGTRRDAVLWSVSANAQHGLRRTNADKRKAVETLLADDEWRAWSNVEIAKRCGVSEFLVRDARPSLRENRSEDYAPRTYTTKHGTTATMDTRKIGRTVVVDRSARSVDDVSQDERGSAEPTYQLDHGDEPEQVDEELRVVDMLCPPHAPSTAPVVLGSPTSVAPQPQRMAVHFSSETPEHYTPREIIDAAVACLGRISLDPCSNAHGDHANVPAAQHFTREDDGLSREWHGTVYMNPPYGREIDAWVAKLVEEHKAGRVTQAIALLPGRIDTQWCKRLRDYMRCHVEGRLTFIGNDDPAPFPSVVFYLGEDEAQFIYCFAEFGDIFQRVEFVGA